MAERTTTPHAASASLARPGERPRLTARPATFRQRVANTAAVWLALMAYWALTDVLITQFPPSGRPVRPDGWPVHALFTLAGLAVIWCMHRTGFPAA